MNVSKDTTLREVISIGDIKQSVFMLQNINLFFGTVNDIEYCTNMCNFIPLMELEKQISLMLDKEKNNTDDVIDVEPLVA